MRSIDRWLAFGSIAAAAVVGASAWLLWSGEWVIAVPGLRDPDDPPEALATGSNGLRDTELGAPSPEESNPPPDPSARHPAIAPHEARRALVEREEHAVAVRGWFILSCPFPERPEENGVVVLRAHSPSRGDLEIEAPVVEGYFDAIVPDDSLLSVVRTELGGVPAVTDAPPLDVTRKKWWEIQGIWGSPVTLHVVDADSGVELTELILGDDPAHEPMARYRFGLTEEEEEEARDPKRLDSPLILSPGPKSAIQIRREGYANCVATLDFRRGGDQTLAMPREARLTVLVDRGSLREPLTISVTPIEAEALIEDRPFSTEDLAAWAGVDVAVANRLMREHSDGLAILETACARTLGSFGQSREETLQSPVSDRAEFGRFSTGLHAIELHRESRPSHSSGSLESRVSISREPVDNLLAGAIVYLDHGVSSVVRLRAPPLDLDGNAGTGIIEVRERSSGRLLGPDDVGLSVEPLFGVKTGGSYQSATFRPASGSWTFISRSSRAFRVTAWSRQPGLGRREEIALIENGIARLCLELDAAYGILVHAPSPPFTPEDLEPVLGDLPRDYLEQLDWEDLVAVFDEDGGFVDGSRTDSGILFAVARPGRYAIASVFNALNAEAMEVEPSWIEVADGEIVEVAFPRRH